MEEGSPHDVVLALVPQAFTNNNNYFYSSPINALFDTLHTLEIR